MPTIETFYLGGLRTEATHLQSETQLITDAPLDNHGKGESFSPTDLLATSLGSCMLTVMGIAGNTHGYESRMKGTRLEIKKIMKSDPRRVGELVVEIYFPFKANFTDKEKAILENTARTCPVALSLHPDLLQSIKFHYL